MKKCVKIMLVLGVVMLGFSPIEVFAEEVSEPETGEVVEEPETPESYNQTGEEGGEYDANDGDELEYRDDSEVGAKENIGEPAIPKEEPRKNEAVQESSVANSSSAARVTRQVARTEVVKTEEVVEEVEETEVEEVEAAEETEESTNEPQDVHNMYIEGNEEKARTMAHFATAAMVVFAGGVGATYLVLNRKKMVIKEVKKPAKTTKKSEKTIKSKKK